MPFEKFEGPPIPPSEGEGVEERIEEEGEKGPAPENLEDQKHRELQEAMDEEDRIMREVDSVLASTPDRAEAEKIVLEKWASMMDEAMKKSSEALKAWLDAMREAGERERKELDDMEKDLGKE